MVADAKLRRCCLLAIVRPDDEYTRISLHIKADVADEALSTDTIETTCRFKDGAPNFMICNYDVRDRQSKDALLTIKTFR